MPNALAAERSVYLRQHADNPIQWLPWSDKAFVRAQQEDKLVFLSIGYSACHWCHVMEQESFSDDDVAAILNHGFIPIKVDREERPDLDAVYMSICQAMTGHGGWPLTVILTPDKKAIFAGTYFPKRSTPYRIGLLELLERVHTLWQTDRLQLLNAADQIMQRIAPILQHVEVGTITLDTCQRAVDVLQHSFDPEYGGFGTQPKFPMASTLWFLLHWAAHRSDQTALSAVVRTLEAMRWGGIWDHVGGGFHRYSTDREWLLPHFEKMLYDQALLLLVYAEAAVLTKDRLFRQTALEIVRYMEQSLALDNGAYATSEDADTAEGEGAYYQWRYEELAELLALDDFQRFAAVFNISSSGNAHDEATGAATGRNILYAGSSTVQLMQRFGGSLQEFFEWWEPIRSVLYKYRLQRPKPTRDEKVLSDWNGLAIAALARAGRILNCSSLVEYAERVWHYLERVHWSNEGVLWHCSYDGLPTVRGFLDDYAFVAWGLLELYQATGKAIYREHAAVMLRSLIQRFATQDGLLYYTRDAEVLPITEPSDGATLSAVGIVALVAHALSLLSEDSTLDHFAQRLLQRYGGTVAQYVASHTTFLIAYLHVAHGQKIAIECNNADYQQLHQLLIEHYMPHRVWQIILSNEQKSLRAMLCRADRCSPLVTEWQQLEQLLSQSLLDNPLSRNTTTSNAR